MIGIIAIIIIIIHYPYYNDYNGNLEGISLLSDKPIWWFVISKNPGQL